MKKKLVLFCLCLAIIFSSAFSISKWTDSVYTKIKDQTIMGLKEAFNVNIEIGGVGGIVAGQVVFYDVVIPDFVQAKKIYVNFNLLELAWDRNIVPAISKITIVDGEFKVLRDSSSQLNVLSLVPKADPGTPPPPVFRGRIVFKDCQVDYSDQIGFRSKPEPFSETVSQIKGEVGFQKKDTILISLSGKTQENSPLQVSGVSNLKNGDYNINILAKKLPLAKWGNYAVPLDPLNFCGGDVDLAIKLSPPKTTGWPLSLLGDFSFHNASLKVGEYTLEKGNGALLMDDENLDFKNLTLLVNGVPLTINGVFSSFTKQKLDFNIVSTNAPLSDVVALLPQTKDFDLKGLGNTTFHLSGTVPAPVLAGTIQIKEGKVYGQPVSGKAKLNYAQNILDIKIEPINIYQGEIIGDAKIDFEKDTPTLSFKGLLDGLDLKLMSNRAPGIVGKLFGELVLSGPINNLDGTLGGRVSGGMFMGQPIDKISATFETADGNIYLKSFVARSENASLTAQGTISKEGQFDFTATAQGIKLAGQGVLGTMEAVVDNFSGNLNFKLDQQFLNAPLKKLSASGEATLSHGKIGQQLFDLAEGKFSMGGGRIEIEEVLFSRRQSSIKAAGQTGIGVPTDLKIYGESINLEDLKILNYFLPEEAQNPTGSANIEIAINGEISAQSDLGSVAPLLSLTTSGKVDLWDTSFADIPITSAQINFLLKEGLLSFSNCSLKTPRTDLAWSLNYLPPSNLTGNVVGIIDFSDIRKFTTKYGELDGVLGLNLLVSGNLNDPVYSASFWLEDFQFNRVNIDSVSGSVLFANKQLSFPKPILIINKENKYEIRGVANLAPLLAGDPQNSYLNLTLKFITADVAQTLKLFKDISFELSRKIAPQNTTGQVSIDLSSLIFPTVFDFKVGSKILLYVAGQLNDCFLEIWDAATKITPEEEGPLVLDNMGGELRGSISIEGKTKNLSGTLLAEVKNGYYKDFTFKNLKVNSSLENQIISIKNFDLRKGRGKFVAQGKIGLTSETLSLRLGAEQLPLDTLQLFFAKDFSGNFDMSASIEGTVKNPLFTVSLSAKNISLANVAFDQLYLNVEKNTEKILLNDLTLIEKQDISNAHGSLDLSREGNIDLEALLKNNALGLVNLFTDEITWKAGTALASLEISGPLQKPDINGALSLEGTTIYVRAIDSNVRDIAGEVTISHGLVDIKALTGIWIGKTSRNKPNALGLAGTINLNGLFLTEGVAQIYLVLSPTRITANLPNLFKGQIDLSDIKLEGPLYIDFSQGPKLSGNAKINNALITLKSTGGGGGGGDNKAGKVFPLNFDLNVGLKKNVYVVMGDIATLDLSNLFMNLQIESDRLKVLGNLAYPSLLGKIHIDRGSINIFNRGFTLLSPDEQKKYFLLDPDLIAENVAVFKGLEGEAGLMPDVTLTAKVDVINSETINDQVVETKVIIISRLKGMIGSTNKDEGLTTTFYSYIEDDTRSPPQITPAGYSEQEIKVMLLPDFIKSLAGIDKGNVDANAVLADYLNSRLQAVLFRGIERELEQRLGLERLTLEYNFGRQLRQEMGVDETGRYEDQPDWRIGFVKGFFDKFYVQFRYSETYREGSPENAYDYQVTYKLSPICSIIYYEEPPNPSNLNVGEKQITLQTGFSFW
ncbi:MAG: DUF748 domain-containing protein [Candidatus Saganbacteria bacterium]|nr:DUF748 domain-containing protein [Candidatus Saganbacteria bacterium]